MRVVYIADDGKEFDDKYDCEDYEWKLNHPGLNDVRMYDEDDNKIKDMLSQDTYEIVMKIIVLNENAVKEMKDLARYTGFCCYGNIDEPGEWVWNDKGWKFVKVK